MNHDKLHLQYTMLGIIKIQLMKIIFRTRGEVFSLGGILRQNHFITCFITEHHSCLYLYDS